MNFKLEFDINPPKTKINIRDKMLMLGSCFAENIGDRLSDHKFNLMTNPNGILFNPVSIIQSLQSYAEGVLCNEEDLFYHDELWRSWNHHGCFSDSEKTKTLEKINASQRHAIQYYKNAKHVIITFGSAFVYELKETNRIVANCHKVPQQHFNKRLLSVDEIIAVFEQSKIAESKSQIILTVSPVRYLRDGLPENNLSKSILLQAVHQLVSMHNNVFYFPAYEIVMDELRDYRFFEEDMVHPNQLAVDYVWERFCDSMLDDETKNMLEEIKPIITAKNHRPFHPDLKSHQQFLKTNYNKVCELEKKYDFLHFEEEKEYFNGR